MARIRQIKPSFWADEELADLSRDARMLYVGLWNLSDDFGVFEWRPRNIKREIFPYDNDITPQTIGELLLCLKEHVFHFESDGRHYGYIPTLKKHQQIQHPSKYRFAIPPDNYREQAESSVPLIEDSMSPQLALTLGIRGEGWGVGIRERVLEEDTPLPPQNPPQRPERQTAPRVSSNGHFEKFWQVYPKKKSKGQAEKAFAKVKPNEQLLATMLATIERAKTSEDWRKQGGTFIPHPATWLNAKGWDDEIGPPAPRYGALPTHYEEPEEVLTRDQERREREASRDPANQANF